MKNVLYLQTGQKSLSESARELLTGRSYQALFCDEIGERSNLEDCLDCLEAGDTLFVLGERQLADSMGECVLILGDLAIKGVNVRIERNGGAFSPDSSPFLKAIGARETEALFQYIKIFCDQVLCETSVDGLMEDEMATMSLLDGIEEEKDWIIPILPNLRSFAIFLPESVRERDVRDVTN